MHINLLCLRMYFVKYTYTSFPFYLHSTQCMYSFAPIVQKVQSPQSSAKEETNLIIRNDTSTEEGNSTHQNSSKGDSKHPNGYVQVTNPINKNSNDENSVSNKIKSSSSATNKATAGNGKSKLHSDVRSRSLSLAYSLYSSNMGPWEGLDGYGSTYEIFSMDGQKLYFEGTYCGSMQNTSTYCDLSVLPSGKYIWRVTGAHAEQSARSAIAWEFCGIQGGAMTQIEFKLNEQGECSPLNVVVVGGTGDGSPSSLETLDELALVTESILEMHLQGSLVLSDTSGTTPSILLMSAATGAELSSHTVSNQLETLLKEALAIVLTSASMGSAVSADHIRFVSWAYDSSLGQSIVEFTAVLNAYDFGYSTAILSTQLAYSNSMTNAAEIVFTSIESFLYSNTDLGILASEVVALAAAEGLSDYEDLAELSVVLSDLQWSMTSDVQPGNGNENNWLLSGMEQPVAGILLGAMVFGVAVGLLAYAAVRLKSSRPVNKNNDVLDDSTRKTESHEAGGAHVAQGLTLQRLNLHSEFEQVDFEDLREAGL